MNRASLLLYAQRSIPDDVKRGKIVIASIGISNPRTRWKPQSRDYKYINCVDSAGKIVIITDYIHFKQLQTFVSRDDGN